MTFKVKPVLTIEEVYNIRDSFWVVFADECKHDEDALIIVHKILKNLKEYRDYITKNGEF